MSRAFSAPNGFWPMNPGRLPCAGMKDAVGVSKRPMESQCERLILRVQSPAQTFEKITAKRQV